MTVRLRKTNFRAWVDAYSIWLSRAGFLSLNLTGPLLQYLEHLEGVSLSTRGVPLRYWLATVPTVQESYPLIEIPDQFSDRMVMTHPYDCNHYDLHQLYYAALGQYMQPMAETVGVDVHWPTVWPKQATFEEYVRWLDKSQHLQLVSHFFGAKSEQISWRTEFLGEEDHLDLLDLAIQHNSNHAQRGEANTVWAATSLLAQADGDQLWVCARDGFTSGPKAGGLVAAMLLTQGLTTVNADVICHSTDPVYKPYSLVNCALVAAVRHAAYGQHSYRLNLGVNFEPQSYKTVFAYQAKPVYNLPLVPPSLDEDGMTSAFEAAAAEIRK